MLIKIEIPPSPVYMYDLKKSDTFRLSKDDKSVYMKIEMNLSNHTTKCVLLNDGNITHVDNNQMVYPCECTLTVKV